MKKPSETERRLILAIVELWLINRGDDMIKQLGSFNEARETLFSLILRELVTITVDDEENFDLQLTDEAARLFPSVAIN